MPHRQTSVGRVAYSDTGNGPTWCSCTRRCTTATTTLRLSTLAASHRVLAVDWPGHGESPPFPAAAGHRRLLADSSRRSSSSRICTTYG